MATSFFWKPMIAYIGVYSYTLHIEDIMTDTVNC